jgi:drug/metabolite transporter (DMT)-like permease
MLPAAAGHSQKIVGLHETAVCSPARNHCRIAKTSGPFVRMILSRRLFDQIAIALSALCIVHCLVVPIVVAVLPIAVVSFGGTSHFHTLMLWLVVPTSVLGIGLGLRVHRRFLVAVLGTCGLAALVVAALWGHDVWSEPLEIFVSVAGSLCLAAAHVLNFREVRRLHRHG